MKIDRHEEIKAPEGVTITQQDRNITIKGPKGEVTKRLYTPLISVAVKDNMVVLSAEKGTKRHKRMVHTYRAHVRNMITGVQTPYTYKLKICSGHFPMNVSVSGNKLIVKNFLGEKSPRELTLKSGASVKVEGDIVIVESCDKELAGNVASDIELLTTKQGRDLRIFQDGIYITDKAVIQS